MSRSQFDDIIEARKNHILHEWDKIKASIPQYEIEVPPPSAKSDSTPQIVPTIVIPNIIPIFKHNFLANVMANLKNKYEVWNEILNHEIITGPKVNIAPSIKPVVQTGTSVEMQKKIAAAIANAQLNSMNLNANAGDFTSKSNVEVNKLRSDNLSLIAKQTELMSQLDKLKQMGLDKIKQDIANQTFAQIFAEKEKQLQSRLLEMQKLRIIEKTNNILNAASSPPNTPDLSNIQAELNKVKEELAKATELTKQQPVPSQNDSLLTQIRTELDLAKHELEKALPMLPNDTILNDQFTTLQAELTAVKEELESTKQALATANQQPIIGENLPSSNDSLLTEIKNELEQAKRELAQAKQELAQAPPMPPNDTTLSDQLTALKEELALLKATGTTGTNSPSQNDPLLSQIKIELESAKQELEKAKLAPTQIDTALSALEAELAQAKLELAQAQAQDPALTAIRAELESAKHELALELAKQQPIPGSDLQAQLAACETEKEEFKQKLLNMCKQQIIEKANRRLQSMNYKPSVSSASTSITFSGSQKPVLKEFLDKQKSPTKTILGGGAPKQLFIKGGAPKQISFSFDEDTHYLVMYDKDSFESQQYPPCNESAGIPCITYATEAMVKEFQDLQNSLNASGSNSSSSSLMSALILTKIALKKKSLYEDIVKQMNLEIEKTIKAGLSGSPGSSTSSLLPGSSTSSLLPGLPAPLLPGSSTSSLLPGAASIGGKTGLMGYVDPIASFTKME